MSIDMILDMAESQTQSIKNLVTRQNEAYTELQKSWQNSYSKQIN